MSEQPAEQTTPLASVLHSCRALFAPGQVVELRALGLRGRDGHGASGWFNSMDALAAAAITAESQQAEGVYVTLNPINPACMARSPNAMKPFQRVTTSDREIVRRHWLPIDLDPVRPSKVSSSKEEIELARLRARDILAWLRNQEWPEPLRAFSSNGIHLLYRIDLANDDDTKETIKRCVTALHEQFSDETVKVDTSVFNAARIWKLWGTVSRKGASTEDRPHRRSVMLPGPDKNYPTFENIGIVETVKLSELASRCKEATGKGTSRRVRAGAKPQDVDLDAFIAKHNIEVKRVESWDGTGKRYILAACIFDPSHVDGEAVLGRSPSGAVFYKCQHDSCSAMRWADVKRRLEPRETGSKSKTEKGAGSNAENGKEGGAGATPSSRRAATENAWELARDFIRENYLNAANNQILLRRHRGQLYAYSEPQGIYRIVSEDALQTRVTCWISEYVEKTTRRTVYDVVHCVGANVTIPDEYDLPMFAEIGLGESQPFVKLDPRARQWICMANGVLDVDALLTGKPASECMIEVDSRWVNTIKLEYPFDITATCPRWCKFLDEVLESDQDRIAVLQEAFGYCLWRSSELEKFFIFVGSGQNGKSTAMNILEAMLGRDNVSWLSPDGIEDRYMRGVLQGKLANICSDMNEVDRMSEELLKKISSGEPIVADRKFKTGLEFRTTVKLFFSTNVLPRLMDVTQGIWRRAIIVPFDVQIPPDRKDTRLFEKLRAELPGIFLWSIQGMVRLMKNREFTHSTECQRTHAEYRRQCFPILTFLDEETVEHEEATVETNALYLAYKAWCSDHGLTKPKPLHMFARDVYEFRRNLKRDRTRTADGERRTVMVGMELKRPPSSLI